MPASSRTKLAAVVLDCSGVMTRAPSGDNVAFISHGLGIDAAVVQQTWSAARQQMSSGAVGEDEFWRAYAAKHRGSLPAHWVARYEDHYARVVEFMPGMKQLAEDLRRSGTAMAIVSNVIPSRLRVFRALGVYELFDVVVLSCEVGIVKPQPAIYELTTQRLGVEPVQAMFVDDKQRNVTGAQHVGLRAKLFHSAKQLRLDLFNDGVNLLSN